MLRKSLTALLAAAALAAVAAATAAAPPFGWQAVPRDAFPVFDDPRMLSAAEAEKQDVIFDRDVIIGVAHNGEAKAYPITIMGVHELGNDTIGGVPIAVSW
jgi:hypothetical protein